MDSTKTDKVESTSHLTLSSSPSMSLALSPKSQEQKPKKHWFKRLILLWLTLGAVIIGITAGLLLRNAKLSPEHVRLIAFPGVIFMNMLRMMVLPLVITSLITGLAQISGKNMGRLIGITFSLYGLTTLLAVITGIALVMVIHPGDPSYLKGKPTDVLFHVDNESTPLDTILDMIRNLFPPNLFEAFLKNQATEYDKKETFNSTTNTTVTEKVHKIVYRDGSNMIGLITLCISVGICISKMNKEKSRVVVEFIMVLDEIVTVLLRLIIWYSPVGIISFVIEKLLEVHDLMGVLVMVSKWMGTLAAGLLIHSFITLPLLYFALTRKNPYKVISGMASALVMAFAAYSSSAAMPTTIICVEENLKIPKMIARFVVPIGVTVNMNGTAVYESVCAIFIAQLYGRELSFGDILIVSFTGTLAAMATVSVPHASIVTLVMVLASIGLPPDEIQLFFAVDAFVGRNLAVVNVLGDGFVAGIVAQFVKVEEDAPENKINKSESYKNTSASIELAEV